MSIELVVTAASSGEDQKEIICVATNALIQKCWGQKEIYDDINQVKICKYKIKSCPDVKSYKLRLNPVWYKMLYSCDNGGRQRVNCL